jgi:hypothetical protein
MSASYSPKRGEETHNDTIGIATIQHALGKLSDPFCDGLDITSGRMHAQFIDVLAEICQRCQITRVQLRAALLGAGYGVVNMDRESILRLNSTATFWALGEASSRFDIFQTWICAKRVS